MESCGLLRKLYFHLAQYYRVVLSLALLFLVNACQYIHAPGNAKSDTNCVELDAKIELQAVDTEGDALDDPALWVHPVDRSKSQILVTNKKGGLHVFDLEGREIQLVAAGRLNNVDVRYDFPFRNGPADIAAASNRSFNAISFYRVDPASGRWKDVSARTVSSKLEEVYGLCMYRSMRSGKFYVIVTSKEGHVEQWELFCSRDSLVDAQLVRQFRLGGPVEGCVADDETGYLYMAEENFGIWKYYAEPVAPDRRLVADTNKVLSAQIEGLALYKSAAGKGYLIASLQQQSRFAIFERQGINRYVGCFSIVNNPQTDGVSHTDGIELAELSLGPDFPYGLLIMHDGLNDDHGTPSNQNVKLIDWSVLAGRLSPVLLTDTNFNYRRLSYPTAGVECK